jgi:hypothetical protein
MDGAEVKTFALDLGSQDETMKICHAVVEILGSQDVSPEAHNRHSSLIGDTGPGELRNLGGVLVFVPEVVEAKALQAAVNYLLLQINVREGMDSGGT